MNTNPKTSFLTHPTSYLILTKPFFTMWSTFWPPALTLTLCCSRYPWEDGSYSRGGVQTVPVPVRGPHGGRWGPGRLSRHVGRRHQVGSGRHHQQQQYQQQQHAQHPARHQAGETVRPPPARRDGGAAATASPAAAAAPAPAAATASPVSSRRSGFAVSSRLF